MNDIIKQLIEELLKTEYPVTRIRMNNTKHYGIKTNGNFKRAIKVGNTTYRISNNDQKYIAMRSLSGILCRIFNITQEDTLIILKKYLNIN
jgi:hypothetical protein